MTVSPVIGMFVSDLQWTEHPPSFRTCEEDWLKVQEGYMKQLDDLRRQHSSPPLFFVGDLFDRWDSPPHIINFAIKWLMSMDRSLDGGLWSIPGNHDLPNHNYREIQRSAYWTLVETGVVRHLTPGGSTEIGNMIITPFPYGFQIGPPHKKHSLAINVALIHDFVWTANTGRPGAPEDNRLAKWESKLKDYDLAVFGDNHQPFISKGTNPKVANCGTMMRRHMDEKDLKVGVVLLHQDRSVTRHLFDTSKDRFIDVAQNIESLETGLKIDLAEFEEELTRVHGERRDFAKTMMMWMAKNKVSQDVKNIILRSLGVKK